jgi:hypothetical protein
MRQSPWSQTQELAGYMKTGKNANEASQRNQIPFDSFSPMPLPSVIVIVIARRSDDPLNSLAISTDVFIKYGS